MSDQPELGERRRHLERQAVGVFTAVTLAMAIVCGAIIVSGWFAGTMDDRFERVFWTGAVVAGIAVGVLAAACFPRGPDDARALRGVRRMLRVGLVLTVIAPALCILSLVADFFL